MVLGNWSCAHPREDSFHLWRDAVTGDLPWPGMVFGLTSIAMFVWCNDQVTTIRSHFSFTIFEIMNWDPRQTKPV